LPKTQGRVVLDGIQGSIEIIRDPLGVPHIFAAHEADGFFALGYVHAQDRLAQMDLARLLARGRLAEIVGPLALDSDRFMRALGLVARAEASHAALSAQARATLEAYASGVNALIASHQGAWPIEFLAGFREPEPWHPVDSLLWGALMAERLSGNWRDEIARARQARTMTAAQMAELWPQWSDDAATTMARLAGLYRELPLDALAQALPDLGPSQASNEWVIAGRHTRSGKPLLVNDPHLGLGAPGQWYLVRIAAGELRLAGASAPGVPAVLLGHNGRIAWGLTTTNADANDVVIERIDPSDPTRYLTQDGPRPFTTRREIIRVKGEADVPFDIRSTRHGIVLSDLIANAPAASGHVLALATASALGTDRTGEAMLALNRARDWSGFVEALRDWHAPMQNIVYADIDGRIGFLSPARLPRRAAGVGWMPTPGWTGEFAWDGAVEFAALPRAVDPPAGRIVNANNRIVGDDFPVRIGRDWDSPYRAMRIHDMLDGKTDLTREDMVAMVTDPVSRFARDVLVQLTRMQPREAAAREAIERLRGWDGAMKRDRPEPLIFNAWMRAFTRALLLDHADSAPSEFGREYPALIRAALNEQSLFCDDPKTGERESCESVALAALSEALATITARRGADQAAWRWGDEHFAPFRHAVLSRVPVLRDWIGFRVPTDGDFFTVNRGAARGPDRDGLFTHVHGAGLRAIYDLADLDASLFMVAPGQSGNPLSPHWGDLARPWADGRHFALRGKPEDLRPSGRVLVLVPR
jgi:penicillin amidase